MTSQPKYFDAQPCEATSPISYQPLASFSQTKPLCLLIIRNKTYNTHATRFPRHKNPARTPELVNKNKENLWKTKLLILLNISWWTFYDPKLQLTTIFQLAFGPCFQPCQRSWKVPRKPDKTHPSHTKHFSLWADTKRVRNPGSSTTLQHSTTNLVLYFCYVWPAYLITHTNKLLNLSSAPIAVSLKAETLPSFFDPSLIECSIHNMSCQKPNTKPLSRRSTWKCDNSPPCLTFHGPCLSLILETYHLIWNWSMKPHPNILIWTNWKRETKTYRPTILKKWVRRLKPNIRNFICLMTWCSRRGVRWVYEDRIRASRGKNRIHEWTAKDDPPLGKPTMGPLFTSTLCHSFNGYKYLNRLYFARLWST